MVVGCADRLYSQCRGHSPLLGATGEGKLPWLSEDVTGAIRDIVVGDIFTESTVARKFATLLREVELVRWVP